MCPFKCCCEVPNAVGYTLYPDNVVVYQLCQMPKDHGMDVFWVFDSLNYVKNLRLGIDAVGTACGINMSPIDSWQNFQICAKFATKLVLCCFARVLMRRGISKKFEVFSIYGW